MRIVFSGHAIGRLREREISKDIALNALKNPDKVELSKQSASRILFKKVYYSQTFKREHLLMLVCEKNKDTLEVVTIIDTSKITKYL
jgi:hypothetical protein